MNPQIPQIEGKKEDKEPGRGFASVSTPYP